LRLCDTNKEEEEEKRRRGGEEEISLLIILNLKLKLSGLTTKLNLLHTSSPFLLFCIKLGEVFKMKIKGEIE
jgi:hypothetical protein